MKENEEIKTQIQEKQEKLFSKKAFIKSGKYGRDILNALLEDDKSYSEKEVKNKIDKYMKGRVI